MLGLVAEKKLVPKNPVKSKVAYHDSCYLGRYNDIYESPRQILQAIPGVELIEVEGWNKKKGLCCGAGGAQMFMEEQNKDRVNVKRTLQLVDALGAPTNHGNAHGHGPNTIASACPFCMTMLKDGVKSQNKEEEIQNLDIIELLAQSCGVGEPAPPTADATAPAA
jgi:Fe-S oxidoreductase